MSAPKTLRALLKRFSHDESGNVLMMFGLSILFLIGIGGSAVDLGLQQLMRVKFQGSADAAATSAGSLTAGNTTISLADRTNAANRYFNLNYPAQFYNIARPTPAITVTSTTVTVTASGNVRTSFVSNFGIPTLPATATSVVNYSVGAAAVYDVSLSIDNSGSMGINDAGGGQTRLVAVRNAARTLTDNFLAPGEVDNRMNINGWDTILLGTPNVIALYDTTNDFTNSNAIIRSKITNMNTLRNSFTNSTVGLLESERVGNLGGANGWRANAVQSVILLTDGENQCNSACSPPNMSATTINNNSLAVCNRLKARGVFVYTIAFGNDVSNNVNVRNFLSNCASGVAGANQNEYFFIAPNSTTLDSAFQQITNTIRQTRISL